MEDGRDIEKFAEKLAKSGREAVLWERRKLQWILEERAKQIDGKAEQSAA